MAGSELYGILAEFDTDSRLLEAAQAAYHAGFRKLDAYSPVPVEGLAEAIGINNDRMSLAALLGGIAGGSLAYAMQWYANVIDYPINVGGRPLNSWPAFVPVTFELTVLGASLAAALAMILANRLPEVYHPCFNLENFARASKDRYFLCIEASDPRFELGIVTHLLSRFSPVRIDEVPFD